MYVFDLTMAAGCATRKNSAEILSGLGFDAKEGHIMSSTLPALAKMLLDKGYPRKQVSNKLVDFITTYEIDDATLYVYAAMIFGASEFSFEDCVSLAYCYLDEATPAFADPNLLDACMNRTYAYETPGETDEE